MAPPARVDRAGVVVGDAGVGSPVGQPSRRARSGCRTPWSAQFAPTAWRPRRGSGGDGGVAAGEANSTSGDGAPVLGFRGPGRLVGLPDRVHVNGVDRIAHLGESVVGIAPLVKGAELEQVAAGVIIVNAEVAAQGGAAGGRESERVREVGRRAVKLPKQVDLADRSGRRGFVGDVANRGALGLGEMDGDGKSRSVDGGGDVLQAGEDLVAGRRCGCRVRPGRRLCRRPERPVRRGPP